MDPPSPASSPDDDLNENNTMNDDLKSRRHRRTFKELRREFFCNYPGCNRPYASVHALKHHRRVKHADLCANQEPRKVGRPRRRRSSETDAPHPVSAILPRTAQPLIQAAKLSSASFDTFPQPSAAAPAGPTSHDQALRTGSASSVLSYNSPPNPPPGSLSPSILSIMHASKTARRTSSGVLDASRPPVQHSPALRSSSFAGPAGGPHSQAHRSVSFNLPPGPHGAHTQATRTPSMLKTAYDSNPPNHLKAGRSASLATLPSWDLIHDRASRSASLATLASIDSHGTLSRAASLATVTGFEGNTASRTNSLASLGPALEDFTLLDSLNGALNMPMSDTALKLTLQQQPTLPCNDNMIVRPHRQSVAQRSQSLATSLGGIINAQVPAVRSATNYDGSTLKNTTSSGLANRKSNLSNGFSFDELNAFTNSLNTTTSTAKLPTEGQNSLGETLESIARLLRPNKNTVAERQQGQQHHPMQNDTHQMLFNDQSYAQQTHHMSSDYLTDRSVDASLSLSSLDPLNAYMAPTPQDDFSTSSQSFPVLPSVDRKPRHTYAEANTPMSVHMPTPNPNHGQGSGRVRFGDGRISAASSVDDVLGAIMGLDGGVEDWVKNLNSSSNGGEGATVDLQLLELEELLTI